MTLLEKYNQCCLPCKAVGDDVWVSVKRSGDTAELAFQGTATARGVLIDADFPAKIYKNEPSPWFVHRGFGDTFKTAIDTIARNIEGCKRVEVYGYSKGGAYAQLMHEWLVFHGIDATTYTFGAPAIIWQPSKEIKARFDTLYRIWIPGDWCSILGCLAGYSHVGEPVRIGPNRLDVWKNYHSKYTEYLADL